MKKHFLLWMILLSLLTLVSCATHRDSNLTDPSLLKETWITRINTNPDKWTDQADRWFLTGEPYSVQSYANRSSSNITTVRTAGFSNINIAGTFHVQILGQQNNNSVYIIGSKSAARFISAQVENNTLYLRQTNPKIRLNNIIVRVNVSQLNHLTSLGAEHISGRAIISKNLSVEVCDCATVFLGGKMNLRSVSQTGIGDVTIIGAYSPNIDIKAMGNGNLNIEGKVGLQNVTHMGDGTLNVIGADTNSLKIMTGGNGTTNIVGYSHLKKLIAQDNSRLYIYWVATNNAYIVIKDNAEVGLAGGAGIINLDLSGQSRFKGQYLHASYVYVNTRDAAHATVSVRKKLFASATGNSSIYFFGPQDTLSSYIAQNAVVLPIDEALPAPPSMYKPWSAARGLN